MKNGKLWEKIKEVQNMAHQDGASERVRNGIYDLLMMHQDRQDIVAWQYRWLNPRDEDHPPSMMEWRSCVPQYAGQTLEERIEELRGYESDGKPQYEVRALFALPQDILEHQYAQMKEWYDDMLRMGKEENERHNAIKKIPDCHLYIAKRLRELADHVETNDHDPGLFKAVVPLPNEPLLSKESLMMKFSIILSYPWPG